MTRSRSGRQTTPRADKAAVNDLCACQPIRLYSKFGIDDTTDLDTLTSDAYPVMDDLYELCEKEYRSFDNEVKYIYTEDTLQSICLGLYSMCKG